MLLSQALLTVLVWAAFCLKKSKACLSLNRITLTSCFIVCEVQLFVQGVVAATDSETRKPPTVKDVGGEGAPRGGGWTTLDNFLGDAEQARFSQAR